MDEKLIIDMVNPSLKEGALTYQEFEQIFSMLSLHEQYDVLEILYKNQIELVDSHKDADDETKPMQTSDKETNKFELSYKDDIFADKKDDFDETKDRSGHVECKTEYLKFRSKVHLSNRVLIRMLQDGDAQAKQDLCAKNQGLVDQWAAIYQRVYGYTMDFEDLEQAGMLGMIKAAERFDLHAGTEFSTYAVWWIKQAITREIMDHGYSIRIPVHRMEQIRKVLRLDSKFASEMDYGKRMALISQSSEMSVEIVEDCLRIFYQFIKITSLDLPVGEEGNVTLGEMIPYEEEISVEDAVDQQMLREQFEEVLDTLTPKEEKVLRLRFGLDDGKARTLEEVGQNFGVTRERIRQIEAKALRKLRHPSRSRKLKVFLD